jgi:hypothetical protein
VKPEVPSASTESNLAPSRFVPEAILAWRVLPAAPVADTMLVPVVLPHDVAKLPESKVSFTSVCADEAMAKPSHAAMARNQVGG